MAKAHEKDKKNSIIENIINILKKNGQQVYDGPDKTVEGIMKDIIVRFDHGTPYYCTNLLYRHQL